MNAPDRRSARQRLNFSRIICASAIMRRMTRTEKLLAELIALPSVNPAFAPAAGASARPARQIYGEMKVADFLAVTAARAGLDVEFQKVLPGRANVIARLRPKNKIRQTILLAPHMDTVGADATKFIPQRKNGRLHGRGACDTKGSVAAMLAALCELAESKSRPLATEIIFAGLIDEEHAQAGSRALVAQASSLGVPSAATQAGSLCHYFGHRGRADELPGGHGAQGQLVAAA